MSASAAFALALLRIDGVGRVTAQRLLAHFPSYDALRATPREQVLLRIKGAPRAADLVARLFDEGEMRPLLDQASETVRTLESRRLAVLTQHHAHWPSGLGALDLGDRPPVLYAYGDTDLLSRPSVSLFARPPLPGPAFEVAQDLVRSLVQHGLVVVGGAEHGFDVVVHKLCASAGAPSVLVTNAGMSRVAKSMRPVVSASVRAGGLLLSPFPAEHGPFPHDDADRALVMAALGRASAFFAPPPDSHEARALGWCIDHDRPTFGVAGDAPLPERVHALDRPIDLDWVIAAASPEGDARP
jgi:predicted Rossmann fold nucleotide-binding protein DprA/Smf involved in DNA uptake